MSEEYDDVDRAFSAEVEPQVRNRDQQGKFISTAKPEPLLAPRSLEGDPDTGDMRDGGSDPRFAEQERRIADGRIDEREGPRAADNAAKLRRSGGDDGYDLQEGPSDRVFDVDESEQPDSDVEERDAGTGSQGLSQHDAEREEREGTSPRYEVTVDGETRTISVAEALRGYIRQETFHKRMTQISQVQAELENQEGQLRHNWGLWNKARQDYEEDVAHMLPREPNWDDEYRRNPQNAWETQKTFQALYDKLWQSRQARAEREAAAIAENDRRTQKYAVDGFSRFVIDNKIPDEPTLRKEIQSMRKTAQTAGFTEYEVATVYDPRMLTVLRKASKYDRMMAANRPQLMPSKSRTLPPGSATPFGNAARKGIDEAQRQLASSGRLDDAAEVFRRIL